MDSTDLQVDPQVLLTELGDGTGVLLHLDTKFYYQLNATGVVVWKSLVGGEPVAVPTIAQALTERFQVEAAAAEQDVTAMLQELVQEGLLRPRTGAPAPR